MRGTVRARQLRSERKAAVVRLLQLAVITGVIAALGLLPVVSLSGLTAKAAADGFTQLPADFSLPPAPEASTLYASDGETVLATFGDQYRIEAEYDDVAQMMKNAILAAEDTRFYDHNGVDSASIMRATVANFSAGEVAEGASTITMQYVRQVLAYTATTPEEVEEATATTSDRKLREMRYAIAVEQEMSKPEILTNYLNTVYFGHNAYGVGAAARVYFGTTVDELDLNESATLAALVQSPSEYDPISGNAEAAKDRRNYVIQAMVDEGFVSAEEGAEAAGSDIPLNPSALPGEGSGPHGSEYGFFSDYFEQWWAQQEEFGQSAQERLGLLNRGGYEIVSSLDADLQAEAEASIASQQSKDSPYALGSAAVEPSTGEIKVMAVNRDYGVDESDPTTTTNPLLSGGSDFTGYQAGSTFKMFTLVAALEAGMELDTSIYSPHRYTSKYLGGGDASSCGEYWCPSNDNRSMAGTHDMWSAFGRSVNTYFVQLAERVGADAAVQAAEDLGLSWHADSDKAQADKAEDWGAFTLGVSSALPLEMATSYATLANDGEHVEPIPVTQIFDASGSEVPVQTQTRQAVDTDVARAAVDAARCPTGYGPAEGHCGGGTASQLAGVVGGPVAGKTGTTDSNSTAWFVGFTPNLAVASFMADPADPTNFLQGGMTAMPTTLSGQILAASWQADPHGEFTAPDALVGGGTSTPPPPPPDDTGENGDGNGGDGGDAPPGPSDPPGDDPGDSDGPPEDPPDDDDDPGDPPDDERLPISPARRE